MPSISVKLKNTILFIKFPLFCHIIQFNPAIYSLSHEPYLPYVPVYGFDDNQGCGNTMVMHVGFHNGVNFFLLSLQLVFSTDFWLLVVKVSWFLRGILMHKIINKSVDGHFLCAKLFRCSILKANLEYYKLMVWMKMHTWNSFEYKLISRLVGPPCLTWSFDILTV